MNPIEKAIDALERISRFEYAYGAENAIHDAQEALKALRDMQEVDVEALKSKIGSELSYTIPHSYSDNTMLNTVQYISKNYHLIRKEQNDTET